MRILFDAFEFEGKALFFDKDGTLTDLRHQYTTLMEKRLDRLMALCPLEKSGIRRAIGLAVGYDEKTKTLSPAGPLAIARREETMAATVNVFCQRGMDLKEALEIAKQAFREADQELCLADLIRPVEGLIPTLSVLSRDFTLACVTNDDHERTRDILRLFGADSFFHLILGGNEVTRPKPDPEMFHQACSRLGVVPSHVAYVGDSMLDMGMARNGGAGAVVGILGGACGREILQENADVVISGLEAITLPG